MILQGRNLAQGLAGADVAELHTELAQLGFSIPPAEAQTSSFSAGTLAAVQQFQSAQKLAASGAVDDTTAAALSAAVQAATYTVTGEVSSPTQPGMAGLTVTLVDKNVGADLALASGTTDGAGRYVLSAVQSARTLTVRLKSAPDLQVKVSLAGAALGASAIAYAAGPVVVLDVVLPADTAGLASEYESLTAGVAAVYSGALTTLQESESQQDVTYLANKTGWDARAIAMAALAQQFSQPPAPPPPAAPAPPAPSAPAPPAPPAAHIGPPAAALLEQSVAATPVNAAAHNAAAAVNEAEIKAAATLKTPTPPGPASPPTPPAAPPAAPDPIRPEFYYALFRAGLPANADGLYQASPAKVQAIWQEATAQGVIPAALSSAIPAAVQTFQSLSASHILTAAPPAGPSTLQAMLAPTLAAATQQQQFAQLYAQHRDDRTALWTAVQQAFGQTTAAQLRLAGQLHYLTVNNAPLVSALMAAEKASPLTSTQDLALRGYYDPAKWTPLIGSSVPAGIPGANAAVQQANYAALLAAQVRLAHPTVAVADQVAKGVFAVSDTAAVAASVHDFLIANVGKFEIGLEPLDAYIARTTLTGVSPAVVTQVKRLQRVYQITPDDASMATLLSNQLDSAYAVSLYDAPGFVRAFSAKLGGDDAAAAIHARSKQVVHTVLNLALGYVTSRSAPVLGGRSPIHRPFPSPSPTATYPVTAYPTLETLFGSMDYCDCPDCRSILSPAAYLVDLLHYLDQLAPTAGYQNPQSVLFQRRPDLQYLPLTCENTNTALPYIDIVNETLEYYVANKLSITGFQGFDTGTGVTSAQLLASPQNVNDAAYAALEGVYFPPPLPYNRPLELLRQHMRSLGVALPDLMAAVRASDAVQRSGTGYAWLDILIEQAGVSRDEYTLFTDPTLKLQGLYGFPGMADADVLTELQSMNLQAFSRRTGVSYVDLDAIVQTNFVNPSAVLIPALSALGAGFAVLAALKSTPASAAAFQANLPAGLDATDYGGKTPGDAAAVTAWVTDPTTYARIMGLIVITDPSGGPDQCSGDALQLRYANPDNTANKLSATDLVKLMLFIRLWKKLGLSIPQTDDVLSALFPAANLPSGANDAANLASLAAGFQTFLPRLGFLLRVQTQLGLSSDTISQLLACWAPIDSSGVGALYASMFLTPTLVQQDPAFTPNPAGVRFGNTAEKLLPHASTLCAAFNLSGPEFALITGSLGYAAATPLTLANISAIFRIGWLAHNLSISVAEFLLLRQFSGLDPFAPLDPSAAAPAEPPAVRFIRLLQDLNAADLPPVQALYLIWNQDIAGTLAPPLATITGLAWTLRADFAAIDALFTLVDDPDGSIAKRLMTLVYGAGPTETFFGLINNTLSSSTPYGAPQPTLPDPIIAASGGRLAYDDLAKTLSFAGYIDPATQVAIAAAITANGNVAALQTALTALVAANQLALGPFFAAYPELLPLYLAYEASTDTPQNKRQAVLTSILPALKQKRKQEQALTEATAAASSDASFAAASLQNPAVLHAANDAALTALSDFTALETQGLSAAFYFGNDLTATPDKTVDAAANLNYAPAANPLPAGGAGAPIAARWSGYLDAPQDGFYNIAVAADAGAQVTLSVAGAAVALVAPAAPGNAWRNASALSLSAGSLTPVVVTVASVKSGVTVSWESQGLGWQVIPSQYLYAQSLVDRLQASYARFFKAVSLSSALSLTAAETAWLGGAPGKVVNTTSTDNLGAGTVTFAPASMNNIGLGASLIIDSAANQETVTVTAVTATTFTAVTTKPHTGAAAPFPILSPAAATVGAGWLNFLAAGAPLAPADAASLGAALASVLAFARIKAALSSNDQRLLAVLQNPAATLPGGGSALLALTGWSQDSVNALMTQFFGDTNPARLGDVDAFRRVFDAYAMVTTCRLTAAAAIAAATNAPSPAAVSALQSALRALYAEPDWLTVVKPINDAMRIQQRDALVAYTLQQLSDAFAKQMLVQTTTADTPTGAGHVSLAGVAGIAVNMAVQGLNVAPGTSVAAIAGSTITLSLGVVADLPSGSALTFLPASAAAVDTVDALYDFFLIDTQTQPAVETSRVRLALSAVQLFIERILRNLEPAVWPKDIDGSLWTWMKRYRVWQANREVFLWPENWLYPELRDDQSEIFKTTMGALLQSDFSDDAAASAYLGYLSALEEVAKLEACGIYHVFSGQDSSEVSYVVARTAGAHRKYYFRTYENASWSPWTQVKIDCEDMPLTPVVWNGRLFLFWLKVTKKTTPLPVDTSSVPETNVQKSKLADLYIDDVQTYSQTAAQAQSYVTIQGILNWSEYYNGDWQPTKTSDVNRPTDIAIYDSGAANPFEVDRNSIRLIPWEMAMGSDDPALTLTIYSPLLDQLQWGGFLMHNTHSLPVRLKDAGVTPSLASTELREFDPVVSYTGGALTGTLTIDYSKQNSQGGYDAVYNNHVLTFSRSPRFVLPQPDPRSWDAPFFYEDARNLFYVTTTEALVSPFDYLGFGLLDTRPMLTTGVVDLPRVVLPAAVTQVAVRGSDAAFLGAGAAVTNPAGLVASGALRVALGSNVAINFAGRQVLANSSVDARALNITAAGRV